MIRILAVLAALFFVAPALAQPLPAGLDKANAIVIDTTKGRIVIKLRTDLAPQHAERIKLLAREGYYNNVPFHRVMDGFMAQTGDGQNFNGTGGSKYPNLKQEFSKVPFTRGILENSCFRFGYFEPPVPLKFWPSPVCAMKPSITRWNGTLL